MNINWLEALSGAKQNETIADTCERIFDHNEYIENIESHLFAAWLADELIPSLN